MCEIICYRILQTSLLSYDANRAGYSPISISGDTHRVVAFRDISLVRRRVMVHYLQQREG